VQGNDDNTRACTGLVCAEFETVFTLVEQELNALAVNRVVQRPVHPISPRELLFITLTHLRLYLPDVMLSLLFAVPLGSIHGLLVRVIDILDVSAVPSMFIDGASIRTGVRTGDYAGLRFAVDSSEIQLESVAMDRKSASFWWSPKTRGPAIKFLLVCSLEGLIVLVRGMFRAVAYDGDLFQASGFPPLMERWNVMAVGDDHFRTASRTFSTIRMADARDEKRWNSELHRYRSVIENVFARMKHWHIIGTYYRGDPTQWNHILKICRIIAGLVNLQHDRSPLRRSVSRFTQALRADRYCAMSLPAGCALHC
jgi:hypothetical protein